MKSPRSRMRAIAIGLVCLLAMAQAQAKTIYKSGSNYTDTPCPQGIVLDTSDPRSPAQKAQTDQATVDAKALSGQLEKTRYSEEAAADRRAQSQAKARAQAVKSAKKAQIAAQRAEAKAKKNQPKPKTVKLGKTNPPTSENSKAPKTSGKPPTPGGKASAKIKTAP